MKRLPQDELTKEQLAERIVGVESEFNPEGYTRTQLLVKARSLGLVSQVEFQTSLTEKRTVVKCYLYTILQNEDIRKRFDDYIKLYSILWWRSMALLNLITHEVASIDTRRRDQTDTSSIEWRQRLGGDEGCGSDELYEELFKGHTPLYLKQAFIPEKWSADKLHPDIQNALECYGTYLEHLRPTNWNAAIGLSAWDGIANHASTCLKTSVGLKIRQCVSTRVKAYIEALPTGGEKKEVVNLIKRPWPKKLPNGVPTHYADHLHALRKVLGMKDEDYLPKYPKLTPELFDFYLHLCKIGVMKNHIMPLGRLGRKHAYFDEKILKHMLPSYFKEYQQKVKSSIEANENTFMGYLGFSPGVFEDMQNLKRKKLKRNARAMKKQASKKTMPFSKKRKKGLSKKRKPWFEKWARKGTMRLPRGSIVRSFLSDGVGLSLYIAWKPTRLPNVDAKPYKPKLRKERDCEEENYLARIRKSDEESGEPCSFISCDLGRAKLYFGASKRANDQGPSYHVFSRKHYLSDIKHRRRAKEHKDRLEAQPRLKEAWDALAKAGKEHDLLAHLKAQKKHFAALKEACIKEKQAAFARMQVYGLKKSSMAHAANRLLDSGLPTKGRLVIGIGDASFGSGGRGETSVPTKGIVKAIWEAKRRKEESSHTRGHGPISIIRINEFRTTKCCCECGTECEKAIVRNERQHSGNKRLRVSSPVSATNVLFFKPSLHASRTLSPLRHGRNFEFKDMHKPQRVKHSRTRHGKGVQG